MVRRRVSPPQSVRRGEEKNRLLTRHGDEVAGEEEVSQRLCWQRDGGQEAGKRRGQLFRRNGRGGAFDAKLMTVDHDWLNHRVCWEWWDKPQINILKSFCPPASWFIDLWGTGRTARMSCPLEHQRLLWSSGKMASMTETPNHRMFKERRQFSSHLITVCPLCQTATCRHSFRRAPSRCNNLGHLQETCSNTLSKMRLSKAKSSCSLPKERKRPHMDSVKGW